MTANSRTIGFPSGLLIGLRNPMFPFWLEIDFATALTGFSIAATVFTVFVGPAAAGR